MDMYKISAIEEAGGSIFFNLKFENVHLKCQLPVDIEFLGTSKMIMIRKIYTGIFTSSIMSRFILAEKNIISDVLESVSYKQNNIPVRAG